MSDSLGDTVALSVRKELSDTTAIEVKRPLKPDRSYRLVLIDTLFKDLNGNHPHDTLFGKYTLKTISAEKLCFSLSGGAACAGKDLRRKWIFLPVGSSEQYLSPDSAGHFRFDSIPAGKGLIGSFIDYNNDNKPTPGSLFPWIKPEPYKVFPDTIEARARWDIEGIEAPACEICAKKPSGVLAPVPGSKQQTQQNINVQKVIDKSDKSK